MNEKSTKMKNKLKKDNMKKKSQVSSKNKIDDKNDSSLIIPDFLKPFITQQVWDQYSPIKRESFKQLIKNPNSFFYRNRPPGEEQKYGSFTPEEDVQFMERVRYFREDLHINDGLWGLFAVPLNGRLGYQCSNHYRDLVSEGKIKDPKYQKLENGKLSYVRGTGRNFPEDSYEKLEKEAFKYIKKCLENGSQQPIAILPDQYRKRRNRRSKKDHKQTRHKINRIITYDDVKDIQIKPFHNMIDIDILVKKSVKSNKDKKKSSNITPVHYAPDLFTGKPMENPYLDQYSGIVLDKETWITCFDGKFSKNFSNLNIQAKNINDLIPINMESYNEFRYQITNVYC